MAYSSSPSSIFASIFALILFFFVMAIADSDISQQESLLSPNEQESVYRVLEAINSEIHWRYLFPEDLCLSGPHGVVCDYFPEENGKPHVTELNFGYVSDYSSNPPCGSNPIFTPEISSFSYLRKLFFYNCFTESEILLPGYFWNLSSSLQELIFIKNPALVGSISGRIGNFIRLRRLVLIESRVSGKIPEEIGELVELEQLVITRNRLFGGVPLNIGKLTKLKVLDFSFNRLRGNLPEEIGRLKVLLKLDLGFNRLHGKIPDSLAGLQKLEFLDLSYNHFANFGIPLFLAKMTSLKDVYLSGNQLGGQIPEIWEQLGGISGLGLSGLGLVGSIPASMGVFLRNVSYLGLDENMLEGHLPVELGFMEFVNDMNLENNRLSGRVPFSAKFSAKLGGKLKLAGNPNLCVDPELVGSSGQRFGCLKLCKKPVVPRYVVLSQGFVSGPSFLQVFGFLFSYFIFIFY